MIEQKTELVRNAIADARRKELETFQRAQDMQWMNNRMEDGRMGRSLALIQREANMEKDYRERTDHAALVNKKARHEIDMGMEIAKVQREETCAYLRRHYLRERDPGLRELARKLSAGYVCRDLEQQILHNHYRKLQDKSEEKQANDALEAALFDEKEATLNDERTKIKRCSEYGQELRQQLVSRQQQRMCQYEDTLIEKKMLDEIMRTIADEDQRELQKKRELTSKTRQEMVTFKQAKDSWKMKHTEMVLQEEKEIEKQQQALCDRSAAIIAERQRRLKEKEEQSAKIAAQILAEEDSRQSRDNIITLLQQQEYLEKYHQDDIAERQKISRVKKENKEALTAQMEEKKERERQERAFEAGYLKEAIERKAAEDQKEHEKQIKLREKNKQYSAELLKQAEIHRRKNKEAATDEAVRAKAIWEYEANWKKEVAEEREKIIKAHVPHLIGYLQAGVIKKDDLPTVKQGAAIVPELASLNIDALAEIKRPKRFAKCNAQCKVLREY